VGDAPSTAGQGVQLAPHELTLVSERQRPLQLWEPLGQFPMHAWPSGMQALAHGFLPAPQLAPHAVPSQVAVPPAGAAHAVHDEPQLAVDVFETHMPLQA
jgi:hypothetical protein